MTTTTYYNLNIVEGTDVVNPLTVDNPNYEKIDETMHNNAVSGVTLATEIANATVHAITRENSECAVIRFIATSNWKAGDTATVDGVPVTALLPSGETLPDGAYVINANVLCILTGTNLTIYAERKKAENANEIAYNNTTVGAELDKLNTSLQETNTSLQETNSNLEKNTFGTKVAVNDTTYTCPCDGIFKVSCSHQINNYVYGYVNGIHLLTASSNMGGEALMGYPTCSVFVRKGQVLTAASNSFTEERNTADFFPYV